MTDRRWLQALEIAEQAFERSPEERGAWVEGRCDDADLRADVEALLRADERAAGFLDAMPLELDSRGAELTGLGGRQAATTLPFADPRSRDGSDSATAEAGGGWQIGPYRIGRKLGEGGMGRVYEAEQVAPVRRTVALKLIKSGHDSREVVARFEAERQALAMMAHPAIAQVFEVGASEQGQPYFAMERVEGPPITVYCDRERLSVRRRAALMIEVCAGVRHAHQKGILHRDLKPSNILVASVDGRALPKIIDFGVAKALHAAEARRPHQTQAGYLVGTPETMSPEQADGLDLDTRSDVYSLGVVLYELLTGQPLFDFRGQRGSLQEIRRRVLEEEPRLPSRRLQDIEDADQVAAARSTEARALANELRGDLDWIVARSLEKDRERRYESASALAADLERLLADEPVEARPPTLSYRLRKLTRRHRRAVWGFAIVALALVIAVLGILVGLVEARSEAEAARRVAEVLESTLAGLDPVGPRGNLEDPSAILDRGAELISSRLTDRPRVRARLLATVGRAYRNLAHYDAARPLLEEAMAVHSATLGAGHAEVGHRHRDLGWLAYATGDFQAARHHFQSALRIAESHADGRWTARGLGDLGLVLWRTGEYGAARDHLERGLAMHRLDADPGAQLGVADTLYLAALVEAALENYRTALSYLDEALELHRAALGPEHLAVAWDLTDRARIDLRVRGPRPTLPKLEQALASMEQAMGPDHPFVAFPLDSLAHAAMRLGDFDRAGKLLDRALEIRQATLGPEHVDITWTLVSMARLTRRESPERARQLAERALSIRKKALGPRHPDVADAYDFLGVLTFGRETELSGECFQKAYDISRAAFGAGHPRTARVRNNLALAKEAAGETEVARRLLQENVALVEELGEFGRSTVASSCYNLAIFELRRGARDDALALLRRAVDLGHSYRGYLDDADLDPLRGDPDFESLVAEVRRRLE